jgi:hypothetical protein
MRLPAVHRTTLAVLLTASVAVGVATPAIGAEGPDAYESAQVGLTYSVYQPTRTLGLARSGFELNGCAPGRDEQINADYGREGRGRWIQLNQSQKGCQDGPDGVGPTATFTVRGAAATVMGDCPGQASTCSKATRAGAQRGAYTTVTLPSAGDGLSATYVEVYSANVPLWRIKAFVRGLVPAS